MSLTALKVVKLTGGIVAKIATGHVSKIALNTYVRAGATTFEAVENTVGKYVIRSMIATAAAKHVNEQIDKTADFISWLILANDKEYQKKKKGN